MKNRLHSPARTRRRLMAAAATAAMAAGLLFATALPASAHDQLESTNPANGSTVQELPAQVSLTFSDTVLSAGGDANEIKVTDAAGTVLDSGALQIADNVVTQPIAGTATGLVTVLWRAVSRDGHPVSGQFSFTVTTPSPTATAEAAPTAVASPIAAGPGDPHMAAASPLPWIIGIGAGVVVIAVIVVLVVARSRRSADQ